MRPPVASRYSRPCASRSRQPEPSTMTTRSVTPPGRCGWISRARSVAARASGSVRWAVGGAGLSPYGGCFIASSQEVAENQNVGRPGVPFPSGSPRFLARPFEGFAGRLISAAERGTAGRSSGSGEGAERIRGIRSSAAPDVSRRASAGGAGGLGPAWKRPSGAAVTACGHRDCDGGAVAGRIPVARPAGREAGWGYPSRARRPVRLSHSGAGRAAADRPIPDNGDIRSGAFRRCGPFPLKEQTGHLPGEVHRIFASDPSSHGAT
ncbi:hypothetical protein BG846_00058 [Streptomyces fradiae ATCC 10745 = DSM 40063]|uniref:Uncharacterized protein n=1 Tax=Streptomyces fradiae ATCC 10745 = DSM 40063 TaxID=1319510 RepID=A0A1Y2P499_STRFR|nr:hypothetical protein BG846_00058 [Streptomyces fradiae ATCC 10745 = DSM 40063]